MNETKFVIWAHPIRNGHPGYPGFPENLPGEIIGEIAGEKKAFTLLLVKMPPNSSINRELPARLIDLSLADASPNSNCLILIRGLYSMFSDTESATQYLYRTAQVSLVPILQIAKHNCYVFVSSHVDAAKILKWNATDNLHVDAVSFKCPIFRVEQECSRIGYLSSLQGDRLTSPDFMTHPSLGLGPNGIIPSIPPIHNNPFFDQAGGIYKGGNPQAPFQGPHGRTPAAPGPVMGRMDQSYYEGNQQGPMLTPGAPFPGAQGQTHGPFGAPGPFPGAPGPAPLVGAPGLFPVAPGPFGGAPGQLGRPAPIGAPGPAPFGGAPGPFPGAPGPAPLGAPGPFPGAPGPAPFGGAPGQLGRPFSGAPGPTPFGGAPGPAPFGGAPGPVPGAPGPFPGAPGPAPFGGAPGPAPLGAPGPFPGAPGPAPFGGAPGQLGRPFSGAQGPTPFGGAPGPAPFGGAPGPAPFGGPTQNTNFGG